MQSEMIFQTFVLWNGMVLLNLTRVEQSPRKMPVDYAMKARGNSRVVDVESREVAHGNNSTGRGRQGRLTFRAALGGFLRLVLDKVTVGVGKIMTSVGFTFEIQALVLVLGPKAVRMARSTLGVHRVIQNRPDISSAQELHKSRGRVVTP